MQKLIFRNGNGKEINLTSGDYGITEWEGFSANELNIQSQQVPFQDGGVFLDALLEQRILSVTVAMNAKNDLEKRYRLRREMISTLNPKLGEGLLIYTNDFLSKQIHVIPQLPVFENNNSNDSGTPKVSCSFVACNPYWEDIEETEVYFNIGDTKVIENEGDVPCQMKIDFYTTYAKNPQIVNITNRELIKYNGDLITPLKINTNLGQKGVLSEKINLKINNYGGSLNDVTFSEEVGLYVAVGNSGTIVTSKNGEDWNIAQYVANEKQPLHSVAYSNDVHLFVAVGEHGFVMTSPDGEKWTEREIDFTHAFSCVIYAQGRFIATANRAYEAISTDGVNWTIIDIATTLTKITYVPELNSYFGVNGSENIFKSANGETWTSQTIEYQNSTDFESITYADNLHLLVAVGYVIATSSDGVIWNITEPFSNAKYYTVEYSKNTSLLLLGGQKDAIVFLAYSIDTINWGEVEITDLGLMETYPEINAFAYSKYLNNFVAVGAYGIVLESKNGKDWKTVTPSMAYYLRSGAYSKDKNCYIFPFSKYETGNILYTSNLQTFTNVYKQMEPAEVEFSDSIYVEELGYFVIVGYRGVVIKSTDGVNWTVSQIENANVLNAVTYSKKENRFYTVDTTGKVFFSSDAENWELLCDLDISYNNVICAIDDKDLLLIGGIEVIIAYKNNQWQTITIDDTIIKDIVYSKELNLIVAVTNDYNSIYTSVDGLNWTLKYKDTVASTLNAVVYSETYSMFVAVGSGGIILFSSDGENWAKFSKGLTEEIFGIINSGKNLVLFGESSCIESLSFEEGENEIQNLSQDSNIGMKLEVGQNNFSLSKDSGNFSARITYRQKYLGV